MNLERTDIFLIQLILEKQRFEISGSTYTQIISMNIQEQYVEKSENLKKHFCCPDLLYCINTAHDTYNIQSMYHTYLCYQ